MILSLSNVQFAVGEMKIIRGVSFEITSGSLTGLIGPNGSGKTSLFNCISGFCRCTGGQVIFNGQDITTLSPDKRAKAGIGRVFQNFGIFREQTLLENILVALEAKDSFLSSLIPLPKKQKMYRERAFSFLEEVNLEEKAEQKAGSLSGGQMRLLEICRTLAFGAELFLLDEPTAGVSPKMKEDILKMISKLKALGKTVLIIEHDMGFIQSFVERMIVMDTGCVFLDDKTDTVLKDKRLLELYFGNS